MLLVSDAVLTRSRRLRHLHTVGSLRGTVEAHLLLGLLGWRWWCTHVVLMLLHRWVAGALLHVHVILLMRNIEILRIGIGDLLPEGLVLPVLVRLDGTRDLFSLELCVLVRLLLPCVEILSCCLAHVCVSDLFNLVGCGLKINIIKEIVFNCLI